MSSLTPASEDLRFAPPLAVVDHLAMAGFDAGEHDPVTANAYRELGHIASGIATATGDRAAQTGWDVLHGIRDQLDRYERSIDSGRQGDVPVQLRDAGFRARLSGIVGKLMGESDPAEVDRERLALVAEVVQASRQPYGETALDLVVDGFSTVRKTSAAMARVDSTSVGVRQSIVWQSLKDSVGEITDGLAIMPLPVAGTKTGEVRTTYEGEPLQEIVVKSAPTRGHSAFAVISVPQSLATRVYEHATVTGDPYTAAAIITQLCDEYMYAKNDALQAFQAAQATPAGRESLVVVREHPESQQGDLTQRVADGYRILPRQAFEVRHVPFAA